MNALSSTQFAFKALFVDLDNTLYNFATAKREACDAVTTIIGGSCDELLKSFIFSFHGVESHEVIREYMKERGVYHPDLFTFVTRRYDEVKKAAIHPYPGVVETLMKISSEKILIVALTNASSQHAQDRITQIGIAPLISAMITPDKYKTRKPDPEFFLIAANILGISVSDICMVGDSLVNDIAPAMKLGITSIHARYGDLLPASDYTCWIHPDYIIDSFQELLPIFGIPKVTIR